MYHHTPTLPVVVVVAAVAATIVVKAINVGIGAGGRGLIRVTEALGVIAKLRKYDELIVQVARGAEHVKEVEVAA